MAMKIALSLLTVAVLASCGGAGTTSPSYSHETGTDSIVIRVSTEGGFAPVEYVLSQVPEFTLYGDGRVIVRGPQIEIYPGPALPNLIEIYLTDQGIQDLIAAAEDFGLFDPLDDYGFPGVTDLPTTAFTVNVSGETHTGNVYALGFEDDGGDLSVLQMDSRRNLNQFIIAAFESTAQASERYVPTAIAVLATGNASQDPNLPQAVVTWPIDPLAEAPPLFGDSLRCVVVTGEALDIVAPLLASANDLTLWDDGTDLWRVRLRPLLPDESTCQDLTS